MRTALTRSLPLALFAALAAQIGAIPSEENSVISQLGEGLPSRRAGQPEAIVQRVEMPRTAFAQRTDLRGMPYQTYAQATFGATRTNEAKIVQVLVTTS